MTRRKKTPLLHSKQFVLSLVHDDSTFELTEIRGNELWVGKCIYCKRKVMVTKEGACCDGTTIEHIRPRWLGGDNTIENCAIACRKCNNQKGYMVDQDRKKRELLEQMINDVNKEKERRRSK